MRASERAPTNEEKKIALRLVPSYVGVNLTDSTTSMGDVYHWVHWHISFLKSIGTCRDLAMAQHVKNPQKLTPKWFRNVGPSKHVLGFAWNVQRFALEQCWHRSSTNQHNFQIVKGNCKWGSLCVCVLRCFMIYAADMFRFFAKYTCKHMYIHANTCLYIRFCIHYFHVCWPHQNKHIKNFQSTKLQRTSFDHGDEMSCLYASRPPPGWRLGDFFSFWHFFQISTKSTLIRGTPLHLSVISRDKESAGFEKLGRNSLDPTHDAQIFFCGTHIFYNSQSSRRYSKAPLFCHARWATCIGRSLHDLCMSSRQLSYWPC